MTLNGKSARLLAIRIVTGLDLDPALTVREIKQFVTENIYGSYRWGEYQRIFEVLRGY